MKNDIILIIWDIARIYFKKRIYVEYSRTVKTHCGVGGGRVAIFSVLFCA
jgi:hypothetical protein